MNTVLEVKRRERVTLFGSRVRKMEWDGCFSAVTLSPKAKFGQLPLLVSTVLSEHSQAHSGHLSMVTFVPSWQHWVVATETVWPTNPEILTIWPFPGSVRTSHTRLLLAPICWVILISEPLQLLFVCKFSSGSLLLVLLGSRVFTEGSGDPSSVLVSSLSVPYPFPSPQANSSFICLVMRSLPNPHPLLEGTTWTQVW